MTLGKLERGDTDREGRTGRGVYWISIWNSGDGAADDIFLVWTINNGASVARKERFAGCKDANIGMPKFVNDWRDDSVMHVAGDDEVEFFEEFEDVGFIEVDRRVNDGNFGFVFW